MPAMPLQSTDGHRHPPNRMSPADLRSRETAQYIADMILELRNMAKSEQLGTLQSLLELAYYEAFTAAHKVEIPEGESEYIASLEADVKRVEKRASNAG